MKTKEALEELLVEIIRSSLYDIRILTFFPFVSSLSPPTLVCDKVDVISGGTKVGHVDILIALI